MPASLSLPPALSGVGGLPRECGVYFISVVQHVDHAGNCIGPAGIRHTGANHKEADLPSLNASSYFSTRPPFRSLNNSLADLILRSGTGNAITRPVRHSKVWSLGLSICPRTFHIFKARSFWLREVSLEVIDLETAWRLRYPSAFRNIRTRERSHLGSLSETALAYLFHRSEHQGRS